jgi:hypothetical protein
MNYAYFVYTSLCNWTNICRLNWSDVLSFLSLQLNSEKSNFFFLDFAYKLAVLLNKVTGQLMEHVGSAS